MYSPLLQSTYSVFLFLHVLLIAHCLMFYEFFSAKCKPVMIYTEIWGV
jgi:hypothetical protein